MKLWNYQEGKELCSVNCHKLLGVPEPCEKQELNPQENKECSSNETPRSEGDTRVEKDSEKQAEESKEEENGSKEEEKEEEGEEEGEEEEEGEGEEEMESSVTESDSVHVDVTCLCYDRERKVIAASCEGYAFKKSLLFDGRKLFHSCEILKIYQDTKCIVRNY